MSQFPKKRVGKIADSTTLTRFGAWWIICISFCVICVSRKSISNWYFCWGYLKCIFAGGQFESKYCWMSRGRQKDGGNSWVNHELSQPATVNYRRAAVRTWKKRCRNWGNKDSKVTIIFTLVSLNPSVILICLKQYILWNVYLQGNMFN